jgi:hypothetical protein
MDAVAETMDGTSAAQRGVMDLPPADLAEQLRQWAAASDAVAARFGAPGDDAEPG